MTLEQLQTARLAEIASEYRSKGYTVIAHPSPNEAPSFLAGNLPDLIAISDEDRVVVDVKPSPAIESERTIKIAKAVAANPPWRYELVTANPSAAPDVPRFGELVAADRVREILAEAETLVGQDHIEAAALVAWGAIEAILRQRAVSAGLELERQSSARLLTELYGNGQIDPELYQRLIALMEFRNAVAHGFKPRGDAPDIAEIVNDARKLQTAA
ncbi:MAG TPA: hypothetical protein VHU41_08875 [Thermoanaerobaculia bacterium]|jgi:hypothetical protein|nr:hypothetical protein [Thermoanaerobaculia bacterium]